MRVDIEMNSSLCYGATCVDLYQFSSKPKNATVALKMKVEKFWELMIAAIKRANQDSIINKKQTTNTIN